MIQKLKTLKRHPVKFKANEKRVICRLFNNTEKNAKGIAKRTAKHVLALSEQEINEVYEHIKNEFGSRHRDLDGLLLSHFYSIAHFLDKTSDISEISKKVLGSYFSMEYSIEAAALFNPSIVLHPDQSGLNDGCVRFVMSLRATGEGHISSVEFMSGEINSSGEILMDPVSPYAATPRKIVNEMKTNGKVEVYFDPNIPLSERVIFPITEEERNGIEDVRLVHFSDEPGSRYYGTFTAYDGRNIRSKMFETKDFINFKIHTLNGEAVQ
ncbi:MAG: glycosidase, partial [Calditrichia bacterium]|nr:glycosidase [Calditrichia bacterium]